jgi:hypothetical protein
MIQHILDNHINGPFTVADLIDTWKRARIKRMPTTRELGNAIKKFVREGVIVEVGKDVPMVARMMQEEAGLIQGQARKTALYMKVCDLERLESEPNEPDNEEE